MLGIQIGRVLLCILVQVTVRCEYRCRRSSCCARKCNTAVMTKHAWFHHRDTIDCAFGALLDEQTWHSKVYTRCSKQCALPCIHLNIGISLSNKYTSSILQSFRSFLIVGRLKGSGDDNALQLMYMTGHNYVEDKITSPERRNTTITQLERSGVCKPRLTTSHFYQQYPREQTSRPNFTQCFRNLIFLCLRHSFLMQYSR